jgi:hypothetical protein
MPKTSQEKEQHQYRAMLIANKLADEYRDWYGWPEHAGFARNVALGEYILELCEFDVHDEWLDDAKEAFLKWKKSHNVGTAPPANRGAG